MTSSSRPSRRRGRSTRWVATQTKEVKGAGQGKGRAITARMTKQKKKNPEKSGLVHNFDQRGACRKGLVRDLEKVAPKQRDSPKNQ